VPHPDLDVLAEGALPTGQRWVLKAGGTRSHFYTFLETVHPDGHRDEGGMGGQMLYGRSLMNTYTGGSDRGLRRVLVRADPRVARVRLQRDGAEPLDLLPVAARPDLGLVFFAALLPPDTVLVSVTAIGADGQELEPQNLSGHETAWRRFQRRQQEPGA
jgi:hypothetical protein